MKTLWLYKPITGTYSEFAKPFRDNETLSKQARSFWNQLDNAALYFLIGAIVFGALVAAYYYTLYNQKPGRRYKPQHWWMWLLITIVATLAVTFGVEILIAKPQLNGAVWLELRIALSNAIYAIFVFLSVSFVWCNFGCRTNAYRYLKLKKS